MDSDLPLTPTRHRRPARFTRVGWALIVAALVGYGLLLGLHVGAYAGGSDSSGYMNHARLLGEGRIHVAPRAIPGFSAGASNPWIYSPLGIKPAPDGNGLVPTYPAGLPLFVLLAAKIVGWRLAGDVVLWLHGMLGVLLTYAAARTFGASCRSSLIASVIVGASPLYLFMTLQAMSDVPALVWTTAAVVAAYRSRKTGGWAIAAGAAYALAVLTRPTNALALVPIAIALGFSARRWLGWIAGGIPGGTFFCLHSHDAYGKWLTTGYGDSAGLATQWITPTLAHYAIWLPVVFTPLVVAVIALPLLGRGFRLEAAVLGAWILVFAGFYSAYEFTHQTWWYLRFLLPIGPALVVGAVLAWERLAAGRLPGRRATIASCLVLVAIYGWSAYWDAKLIVLKSGEGERIYPRTADWVQRHLPTDAVVATMQHSGALYYYTKLPIVRWDMLQKTDFAQLTATLASAHRPLYAVLDPWEITDQHALADHMPGNWTQVGHVQDVLILRWSAGGDPRS